jgi:hypothetical protein
MSFDDVEVSCCCEMERGEWHTCCFCRPHSGPLVIEKSNDLNLPTIVWKKSGVVWWKMSFINVLGMDLQK